MSGIEGGGSFEQKKSLEEIEKITEAAIQYKGEIFTGLRHEQAWYAMTEKHPDAVLESAGRVYGFLTSTGRFVEREEGRKIAEKAKQLNDYALKFPTKELYSDDLLHVQA